MQSSPFQYRVRLFSGHYIFGAFARYKLQSRLEEINSSQTCNQIVISSFKGLRTEIDSFRRRATKEDMANGGD